MKTPNIDWHVDVEAWLAIGSLGIFAAALYHVMGDLVPPENEKYVMLMLGALIGTVKDCFGRYFTATKGGQEQRRAMDNMAKASADTAAVAKAAITPTEINVEEASVSVRTAESQKT